MKTIANGRPKSVLSAEDGAIGLRVVKLKFSKTEYFYRLGLVSRAIAAEYLKLDEAKV